MGSLISKSIFIIIFILLSTFVFAETNTSQQIIVNTGMTPEDKMYIDGLNQKIVAQLTAKIDSQTTFIQASVKNEFDKAKGEVITELETRIKSQLKSLIVGLAGFMLVCLAIIEVIKLRLSHNRVIKKYEDELKEKIGKLDEQTKKVTQYRKELDLYRDTLSNFYVKMLKELGIKDKTMIANLRPPALPRKPMSRKAKILIGLATVVVILLMAFVYLKLNRVI